MHSDPIRGNDLILAFQKALLFNVSRNTRQIAVLVDNETLTMQVALDEAPSDEEKDMFYSVCGEVVCEFEAFDLAQSNVIFFVGMDLPEPENERIYIFARCDD